MASSSTHHHQQILNYEVFLSFRGEDTRMNFVGHLYTALNQKGIHVFKDDKELERGKEISPELLKAIEESTFSIIIFSKNYAFSKWCLDELAKIMDCTTKQTGQAAFPIFYNVDPSDVRKQTGKYGEAFLKHENEHFEDKNEKIQRWKAALTKASNLSGWDSRNRHESDLIQEIVEEMFEKLNNHATQFCEDNIVGMDFHMKEMNTLLSKDSNDVKFIGIYGLGGIGKTTIAKATYDRISYQFEASSYLADVREKSKNGLVNLQKKLLNNILKLSGFKEDDNIGSGTIKNRLCNKRVLVILDDVDDIDQLEGLAGCQDWFGPGSRIIITTRDEHLLDVHDVVERYKVKALDQEKSLEFFSLKAFKRNHPPKDFIKLSNEVVNYCKGLPLALKVLGSFLCGRSDKTVWTSALDKLEKVPHKDVVQILKISYEGLEETDKNIFLDIACFFKGEDKECVQKILDSCGFFAGIGMQVLKDRSLITVSDNNEVLMHDLVQEMGRDIVLQECPKNPGRRSRLWRNEDICHVLNNNLGTGAVEAIMTNECMEPNDLNSWWSHDAFMKMYNLRMLKMCGDFLASIQIKLPKIPKKLKFIQLTWIDHLTEIPDLTEVPNLEHLILDGFTELSEIHTSVMLHKRLKYLSLERCSNLTSLPSRIEMESLETLDLSGCVDLEKLPSSINNIPCLKVLNLSCCFNLECLPNSICTLKHLEELLLDECRKLTKLPEKLGDLESLVKLDVSWTAIEEVPPSIELLKNLQWLSFKFCRGIISLCSFSGLCSLTYLNLRECNLSNGAIPDDIGSLSSLETLDLSENIFVELPSSICQLSQLTTFLLVGCKLIQALPELPSSIETILADNCKSLERLPNASTSFNSKNVYFGFANCLKILENQSSLSDAIKLFQHQALFGNSETFSLCLPGNVIPEWFNQNKGPSIVRQLPSNWYNSKLRGLAFCVVVNNQVGTNFSIRGPWEIVFSCNDSPMEIQIPYTGYGQTLLGTHHLVLGYISRAWVRENEKGEVKAVFEFKNEGLEVMKCRIRLVYGDDDVDDENENAKFFKERHQHHGESSKVLGLEELCEDFCFCDPSLHGNESSGNDFSDGDHPSKRPRT